MTFAVDRAGIVGEDGETHQGLFDTAMLGTIPNIHIYCPAYFSEMKPMLYKSMYIYSGPSAVRYPRGSEKYKPEGFAAEGNDYDIMGQNGAVLAVTYGRIFGNMCEAVEKLASDGLRVDMLKLGLVKPIPVEAINAASAYDTIVFFEEGIKHGGVGEDLCALLSGTGWKGSFIIRAVDDRFVAHASVNSALAKLKLDPDGMYETIKEFYPNTAERT